jgi:DUF1365 family protein
MAMKKALVFAQVMHARQRPKKHVFHYGVSYLSFVLSEISQLKMKCFSVNRWNLFSFYEKDHGPRDGTALDLWIRKLLAEHNITEADGDVRLLTLPRLFGYVFNPVSFWLCFDKNNGLRAVLSEVSNTFGEHHSYLSCHDDHRPIEADDWLEAVKAFHVSPFLGMTGYYRFKFMCRNDSINVTINYFDNDGLMLATNVAGNAVPLTPQKLLYSLFRFPLVTFKVIGLIHMEAVRLLFKGAKYHPKPPPPKFEISS